MNAESDFRRLRQRSRYAIVLLAARIRHPETQTGRSAPESGKIGAECLGWVEVAAETAMLQRSMIPSRTPPYPLCLYAVRTSLTYEDATIHDQSSSVSVLTPAIAAAFPGRFLRDDAGKLVSVDLSPVNLYRERQRALKASLSYAGPLGSPPQTEAQGAPAKVIYFNASLTPTLKLEDKLWLGPDTAPLDLLDGDNITASGGRSRWDVQADLGLFRDGLGVYLQSTWHSGSRARNSVPTADLSFAPLGTTNLTVYTDLERLLPNEGWAKKLMIDVMVNNIANTRPRVRDRLGATPVAYQPAYLDPLGRTVTLRMFKRF